MQIAAILDELRKDFPGCAQAAYADLSAGMVLATSAASAMPQEHWDGLSAAAVDMLVGRTSRKIEPIFESGQDGSVYHAVRLEAVGLGIFVRSYANPDDALCCLCAPEIAVQEFLARAQSCLERIDGDA